MSFSPFVFLLFPASLSDLSASRRVEKIFPKDQGGQGPLYRHPTFLSSPTTDVANQVNEKLRSCNLRA